MSQPERPDMYAKGMVHYGDPEADATPAYDRWQYRLLKPYLGRRILEVGAGSGRITGLVAADGAFDELVALEPSPHFFRLLQRRLPGTGKVALLQRTPAELAGEYASHFDSVFSVHVMEHIEDDRTFLSEQIALTKPAGNVIVLVPALQGLYSDLDRNIGHFRRYDKRRIRDLVRGLGVDIERLFYSNALGVLGSLYFSKLRRIEYQSSATARRRFFRVYGFFSEHVVPWISAIESVLPVPIGLNLTIVLRKVDGGGEARMTPGKE